jgi:S-adenosylmethionine hydrolase
MLVVMHSHATPEQIDQVIDAVRRMNLTPHPLPGATRTAIGITGNTGAVDPETLEVIRIPEPGIERGKIECEVLDLNRFGNVQLNVREEHVTAAGLDDAEHVRVESQTGSAMARRVQTYGDLESGEWGLLVDSRRWLTLVRGNPANAAEGMGVSTGDLVWLFAPA